MADALPPDSPMDDGWTAPASTKAQASRQGPQMNRPSSAETQLDTSLGDPTAGKVVMADPLGDQTDTGGREKYVDLGETTSFRRTSLLQEKMSGGYTPNTAPVGQGVPNPTPTVGTRGAEDTEAIQRIRGG